MTYTITLDVHKRETQACIADEKGTVLEKRFRTSPKSYHRALKKYADGVAILECVGFYRPVSSWLQELGLEVHVANVAQIPKPRIKTDPKDARHLLRLWKGDALPESYLPPDEVQRVRDITRHRMYLATESRRFKGKLKHDLYKHGHFVAENPLQNEKGRSWLRTLEHPEILSTLRVWENLQIEIRDFNERIEKETTDHAVAKRLMTVPGIGAYTALAILAEVGDFARFPDGDKLAAYAGLVPSLHQSGDTERLGQITKLGNPILRYLLVETAHSHVRYAPQSAISIRHRRIADKRGKNKAIVATARQFCLVLKAMIDHNQDFQVNP